jgi:LytS/YehU family sensor histidine kinase
MDKDVEGANRFITGFSKLIRNTLEFSAKQQISITEEMEYISTYLALERERLANKFTFNIAFKDDANYSDIFIPPMILQPYVENSVRHGVRYRNDNNGVIDINIEKHKGSLFVTIEDNGVGRKEAAKYKSKNIIHYQSKGMNLTASRIEMMNKHKEGKMKVLVEDLEENNVSKGTRVTIIFPIDDEG